ncbi:hypothetical protein DEO72_LG7g2435 [Vigna unguiculata]|uniref:Uncharacterized protein n=1 Tax=Vigna unguiculata TaxID=3917 RepID=A0A4D6MKL2_VIGUN|nr:hypothetical protein DEO72_LG7g2435 [Vigna unguiculata]
MRSLYQPPTSATVVALWPLVSTRRLAHSLYGLAKCNLGLAKWARVRCVASVWHIGVVRGWRSVVDGRERVGGAT